MLGSRLRANEFFQTTSREALLLLVVFLGFLWAILINHLRIEWTLNPQYGYGWAVPFLCGFLLWKKFSPAARRQSPTAELPHLTAFGFYLPSALFELFFAPTRLVKRPTRKGDWSDGRWRSKWSG